MKVAWLGHKQGSTASHVVMMDVEGTLRQQAEKAFNAVMDDMYTGSDRPTLENTVYLHHTPNHSFAYREKGYRVLFIFRIIKLLQT